ncbi:MAG: hypothetical protein ACM3SY_03820 [Candidatus Omnitrophota bacterium]
MDYKIGSTIPDEDILKCFKDEDENIFIEARGAPDSLFRVTEGNRVYYKIKKESMQNESLILIGKSPWTQPPQNEWEGPVALQLPEIDAESESPFDVMDFPTGEKIKFPGNAEGSDSDLNEGMILPDHLKPFCKTNMYGGFSLRYNKSLFMLDKDYRIEIRTPDSFAVYNVDSELPEFDDNADLSEITVNPDAEQNLDTNVEFYKGDFLPAGFRTQCEAELDAGGFSRIMIGDHLYILDDRYSIVQKMKVSYFDEDTDSSTSIILPEHEIVDHLIAVIETSLKKNKISADFFKESVLDPKNRPTLISVYNGDLTELNDHTREAAAFGEITVLDESGLSLLKAALIHELYIKSTLAGRGENMRFFLTAVVAAKPDGTIDHIDEKVSFDKQQRMVEFFGERANIYTDKTDIIKRVYRQIRSTIYNQYQQFMDAEEKILFRAFLILKLYEYTTRLDRGNGLTMIRLSRDIMDH